MDTKETTLARPIVSVIMANYNAADYIATAVKSVLAQSISQLEILLADDASCDASVAIARQMAAMDARLKIIETNANAGPAAARNRALDAATGDWVAIVDSDDAIHPRRFELMLAAARELQTDAITDDLTYFTDNTIKPGGTLLGDTRPSAPRQLTANSFVSAAPDSPQLGYLKPMIRHAALNDLRYREDIRIGEDHDFYMRFLLNGGHMHLLPESYYLYRRHSKSVSYRMHPDDVRAMIAAQDDLLISYPNLTDDLRTDFSARRAALQKPLAFETLVQHIKNRQFGGALWSIARNPALLWQLGIVANSRIVRSLQPTVRRQSEALTDPSQWTLQDWSALSEPRSS